MKKLILFTLFIQVMDLEARIQESINDKETKIEVTYDTANCKNYFYIEKSKLSGWKWNYMELHTLQPDNLISQFKCFEEMFKTYNISNFVNEIAIIKINIGGEPSSKVWQNFFIEINSSDLWPYKNKQLVTEKPKSVSYNLHAFLMSSNWLKIILDYFQRNSFDFKLGEEYFFTDKDIQLINSIELQEKRVLLNYDIRKSTYPYGFSLYFTRMKKQ